MFIPLFVHAENKTIPIDFFELHFYKNYLLLLLIKLHFLFVIVVQDERRPRSREEIRLEDFFWTGSGDGKPPPDIWANHGRGTGIARDHNVIIKTETVVATVYLDGNNVRALSFSISFCYLPFE